jgi:hypothetical protein
MDNISFVTYTHENASDVWEPYFDSLDKYSATIKSYCLSNKVTDRFSKHSFIEYDDNKNYSQEFIKALEGLKEDYFIYMQEDFILYDFVNLEKIKNYINTLENSKFSFIRLIKCGNVTETNVTEDLYLITELNRLHGSINSFSMQPTIWKKKDFIELYKKTNSHRFGETWQHIDAMNKLKINGLYAYNGENKRGANHFDSSVFPYIATAIVKGKWNTLEYKKELKVIFDKYSIDPNARGTNG